MEMRTYTGAVVALRAKALDAFADDASVGVAGVFEYACMDSRGRSGEESGGRGAYTVSSGPMLPAPIDYTSAGGVEERGQ